MPNVTIDNGVMEHAQRVAVVPSDLRCGRMAVIGMGWAS
jgi:mannose-1-phosphate guanylyltransferase